MSDTPFTLKGFEPISRLGSGGFGEVWLAKQVNIDRQVAIKIGHAPIDDKTVQMRFERECIALGRLSGHPNIIDVFTAGQLDDGRPYLVLEFVNGGTLWQRLQRSPLDEAELCQVGVQLSDALGVAHAAGVLHRDLKPENVLLRRNGDAVLGDFGIARLHDGANTTSHAITASVAYAAPEILSGKGASVASDLYGIGICLLAAVLRSVPFVNETDESIHPIINRVLTNRPPELTQHGVSKPLSDAIATLLAKDPDKRPSSAGDAKMLFEAAANPGPSSDHTGAGATVVATPPPNAINSGRWPAPGTTSGPTPAAQPGHAVYPPAQTHGAAAVPPTLPAQHLPAPPRSAPPPAGPSGFPHPPHPPQQGQPGQFGPSPAASPPPASPPPAPPPSAPPPPAQQGYAGPHQSHPYAGGGVPPPSYAPPSGPSGGNDRWRMFAFAFGATIVIGGLLLFVLSRLTSDDDSSTDVTTSIDEQAGAENGDEQTDVEGSTTTTAPTTSADVSTSVLAPLTLPLSIDDTSLRSDSEITPDLVGPDAPQFCDNRPVTVGLSAWEGETIADPLGFPLLFQEITRFDSAAQAQAHLTSYVATVNCSEWVIPGENGNPDITLEPEVLTPPVNYGDGTEEIRFEGSVDFATIVSRTALVRLGTDVYLLSITTLDESDLAEIDELLELAVNRLES